MVLLVIGYPLFMYLKKEVPNDSTFNVIDIPNWSHYAGNAECYNHEEENGGDEEEIRKEYYW